MGKKFYCFSQSGPDTKGTPFVLQGLMNAIKPVCIYVDNSNIYIGGRETAKKKGENPAGFRIEFDHFIQLVTGGTMQFNEMVWAGSGEEDMQGVFAGLKDKGIDLQIIPRAVSGENETVDCAIQLAMYRHTRKYRDNPGLIVLCTGDGKGFNDEKGFLYDVTGFIEDGWQLVLFSWDSICHGSLKKFAQQFGRYEPLEPHYGEISFIKHGRPPEEVDL